MSSAMDAIDTLAGIAPGSAEDALRRRKPITRDNAQMSFDTLFSPAEFGGVSAADRAAIALFVAGLHGDEAAMGYYGAMLAAAGPALAQPVRAAIKLAGATGPYGSYPPGPLTREDVSGPVYSVSPEGKVALGAKLSAALEHTHMLVFHLRDASPAALQRLQAVGWSVTDIVTLSQLVAFLSFQLRAAFGLRALAAHSARVAAGAVA